MLSTAEILYGPRDSPFRPEHVQISGLEVVRGSENQTFAPTHKQGIQREEK